MSVEIDITDTDFVTKWGVIEEGDPDARPETLSVKHLMLITPNVLQKMMAAPQYHKGGWGSAYADGDRMFVRLKAPTGQWTWELYEAHFSDGKGPEIFLGRWPD